ncbi:hypothetical protein [Nitrospina gracilis]|uniref:hypothetical protein n=1 Tax=Nitrospina gracilis TaxID=35801 RepID=UPI001F1FDEEB|nr:hypothetical protein [Nitrospina gracilis]MCF8720983.1 hypothetical protein [Nitrospina gracilis Nb-211]
MDNETKSTSQANPPERSDKKNPPEEKGNNVQDILQKARRRGIQQKGQQGVIEFDYPRKKE